MADSSSSSSTSKKLVFKDPRTIKYQLKDTHLAIPYCLFAENRRRLCENFKSDHGVSDGLIFLQGGVSETRHATDHEPTFRQESFFWWGTGLREPDMYATIRVSDARCTLIIPNLPDAYKIWMGPIKREQEFMNLYGVENVILEDFIEEHLLEHKDQTIYRLEGTNSDSKKKHQKAQHACLENVKEQITFDDIKLWHSMVECRVIKSEAELDILRHVTKASSNAHKAIMKNIQPGWGEFEAESLFHHEVYSKAGCRHVAYCCIGASGENGAILHYGHAGAPNDKEIKDGDMCLFDMGGEYHCFCSDITCSFPANGKFTDDQKIIYQAAFNAWKGVTDNLKAGVEWPDMHKLAEREMLTHLKKHDLIKGDLDDMMRDRLGALFMPHGLGHFIGCDTHDVGGYMDHTPKRSTLPGLGSLRTARRMEANMCITIEPGCYIVWSVVEETAAGDGPWAAYLNMENLKRFKHFGGVRIESDVIVHEDCCEDMCDVPRTIEEIEEWMKKDGKQEE